MPKPSPKSSKKKKPREVKAWALVTKDEDEDFFTNDDYGHLALFDDACDALDAAQTIEEPCKVKRVSILIHD